MFTQSRITITNWSEWSCCGKVANSPPCTLRPIDNTSTSTKDEKRSEGVGAFIHFLNNGHNCRVVGDELKCWRLEGGRIAKKRTEGEVWLWLDEYNAIDSVSTST